MTRTAITLMLALTLGSGCGGGAGDGTPDGSGLGGDAGASGGEPGQSGSSGDDTFGADQGGSKDDASVGNTSADVIQRPSDATDAAAVRAGDTDVSGPMDIAQGTTDTGASDVQISDGGTQPSDTWVDDTGSGWDGWGSDGSSWSDTWTWPGDSGADWDGWSPDTWTDDSWGPSWDAEQACMPGEVQPCTCSGDLEGTQTCDEDGQWEACECADEPSPCEACLASGGTWQPEASACTQNCDFMDISCYTTSCPKPCSTDSCGTCFGQEDCEEAGCQWHAEGPAMWCTSPW